jgi:hypothetical protein
MTTNRTTSDVLNPLLTGYLIDSVTNYCGRHIEGLRTLKLSDDFFTKTASMDDDTVQPHLITEFSKLDTGFFHFNKHKRLAKKLAKYICETQNAYQLNEDFTFNPINSFHWPKSDLYLTFESTNAELNYISQTMTSPHYIAKEKTDENKKTKKIESIDKKTVLDYLKDTTTNLGSGKSILKVSSLRTESLAKAIRDELLERLIYTLSQMKTQGRQSNAVDEKINLAIGFLKQPIDSTTELSITNLRNALEKIAVAINDNYAWFQSVKKEDKEKLKDINEMLLRFSRDGFICTLTEKLLDNPVNQASGPVQAESKEGLKGALGKLIKQKQAAVTNTKSRNEKTDDKKSSDSASSTQEITERLSNVGKKIVRKVTNAFTPGYSAVANSENSQKPKKIKTAKLSRFLTFFGSSRPTDANHKTKNTSALPSLFKKVLSGEWRSSGKKPGNTPKT